MSFSLSEYTKIDVGWGFTPESRPHWGSLLYSDPPDLLDGFKGAVSRQEGMEGRGSREGLGRREDGKGGEGEWGREGKGEVGE